MSNDQENQAYEDNEDQIEHVSDAIVSPATDSSNNTLNKKDDRQNRDILYTVDECPSWYMCILLGLQHYLVMVGPTIAIPLLLTPLMCIDNDDPAKGIFVSTIIFVSGVITLLQSTLGVRLPIVQGGTFSIMVPTFAILSTEFPSCKDELSHDLSPEEKEELYLVRIRAIQGAICVASLAQVIIGATGLIGHLLKYITPLVIIPIISLTGLSLFEIAADMSSGHWGIAILTMFLLILFSQYFNGVGVPVPFYTKAEGFSWKKPPLFTFFPVLFTICVGWLICAIVTISGGFPEGSPARTDLRTNILKDSKWFYIPYPFQFGIPTVSAAGVIGMLAGLMASMVESIGDYYACARLAGANPPPVHAINRGITIEGIGSIFAGIWGTGNGTTSYSENIGAIRVTKVGSRRVVETGALLMIFFGCFGKFGALCVTIPDPVVGGVFFITFAMITAVGLSNLQVVDLNSSRNLFILGFSLFFGLAFPEWMLKHPKTLQSGSQMFDQILTILLSTHMFVGGFVGFVLDNTIPGTLEERGIGNIDSASPSDEPNQFSTSTYDLPIGMEFIKRTSWMKRFPLSPTFELQTKVREDEEQGLSWKENFKGIFKSAKKRKS